MSESIDGEPKDQASRPPTNLDISIKIPDRSELVERSLQDGKSLQPPSGEVHEHIPARGFISSIALGISDGLVTNLAFLAGFAGAIQSIDLIRFAGAASMLAGAVSMFFGALLASRSELDLFRADSRREAHEIENEPEEEKQELTNFYLQKGLTPEEARIVVARVTSNKEKWLEDILVHELHLHKAELQNPYRVAAVTGLSFLVGAFVPLGAYLFPVLPSLASIGSFGVSFLFLFVVGAWKGKLVSRRIWKAGLEMLLVGACASLILFLIGRMLVFV